MKRSTALLLPLATAVLALTSPSLRAQDSGAPRGDRLQRLTRNPVAMLVDSAQVLRLSGDQAARLRSIAQELDVRDRPAVDSLDLYRPRDGGGGGMGGGEMTPEMRERMQHLRPIIQQLRENHREAMEQAMAVLTPEQRERAQAMLPPERMGPGRGGPGGPPRP
ncbi:MAG TPA: hypothetical protein VGO40_18755 [Longimicrobium sp.]|nr:hypothetical protein [Longimicrobium sp.]